MSKRTESSPRRRDVPDEKVGVLAEIIRYVRLCWRLLGDRRVPFWVKVIPALAVMYVLWPIDALPDPALGLGQFDDVAIILLGLKLFVALAPVEIVEHLRREIGLNPSEVQTHSAGPTVDADYRVVPDEAAEDHGAGKLTNTGSER